jgi:RNA recognition motif 2
MPQVPLNFLPIFLDEAARDIIMGMDCSDAQRRAKVDLKPEQIEDPIIQSLAKCVLATTSSESVGGLVDTATAFLGQDERTTVMLKRIPRKMTSLELAEIVDSVNGLKDSFDFCHIPWDASRNTSRGFAFINFISPLHVGILSDAIQSGILPQELKNCELRYARIQGDALTLSILVSKENTNLGGNRNI